MHVQLYACTEELDLKLIPSRCKQSCIFVNSSLVGSLYNNLYNLCSKAEYLDINSVITIKDVSKRSLQVKSLQ